MCQCWATALQRTAPRGLRAPLRGDDAPGARRRHTRAQYGGALFARCAFAASIHHARSSANRGNASRQRLARLADRLAVLATASARSGRPRACLKSPPCPSRTTCRATRRGVGAGETAGRIAGDRGGAPEPFFEEMIGEVFQARLHAPIVFAGDEHKTVGIADFPRECFEPLGRLRLSDIPCTSGPASADRSPWRRSVRRHRRARENLR